jgi:transcriptional regulator with XRE-family HTH domain
VQKYEHGVNRVSASKLYKLSVTLGVPVDYFFDDLPLALAWKGMSRDAVGADLPATQETQELVRAYYVPGAVRPALCQVVQSAARAAPGSATSPASKRR